MDVNDLHSIVDSSAETYRIVADLIEGSVTEEQLVYRECELDELWRVLQTRTESGQARTKSPGLAEELRIVVEIHDVIASTASASDRRSAAQRLRTLADRA